MVATQRRQTEENRAPYSFLTIGLPVEVEGPEVTRTRDITTVFSLTGECVHIIE